MEPEDDWAPLPPETVPLAGETPPAPPRRGVVPTPTLRPRAADAPPPTAPTDAERAEAERLLAELRQRLGAAPAPPLDPVHRAYAHATRKAAAAATFAPAPALPRPPVAPDDDRTPGIAGIGYASDRDPREDEPWFAQLPADEQARLRRQWHGGRHRFDELRTHYWRDVRRATWQGALVFVAIAVMQAPMLGTFGPFLQLLFGGALAGAVARMLGGDRFAFAGAGTVAFLAIMGPRLGVGLISPVGLTAILIASYGMGLLGFDREMKRAGGFSPKE